MTFEEFKNNVRTWSTERGIYEHSTSLAQALKAVSEVGELCDGVIKNDIDAIKDAIGDVAVCLVNVAEMISEDFEIYPTGSYQSCSIAAACVANLAGDVAKDIAMGCSPALNGLITELSCFAQTCDLDFLDCCESAWNEIKDRRGKMVAGGAFVKE